MSRTPRPDAITRPRIAEDLSDLGLGAGDVVFLHSSLKSIGWVEGGPDSVIDAFLDVVGSEGLVIVPTFTFTFARGELSKFAFDPRETPSRVGRITDSLWRRPKAFRSAHPTHSIAAIGPRAEELVVGHEKTSTFGKDGPYRRYVDWGAKILFLGVEGSCNTTLHAIEDWLDLPYLQVEEAVVKGADGERKIVEVTKCPMGDRDFYRKGSKVERLLESSGMIRRGRVGAAASFWLPSQEMVQTVVEGIYENPPLLLCDRAECDFCTRYRPLTTEHVEKNHPTI